MRIRSLSTLLVSCCALAVCLASNTRSYAQDSGEKIYKAKCASCHGPDGAGATPAGKATKARAICSDEVPIWKLSSK